MQDLLRRDADVGLYLLFQLASSSSVGYSASHALVCAVLCHLIGTELGIAPEERDGLVYAALTMNVAIDPTAGRAGAAAGAAQCGADGGHSHPRQSRAGHARAAGGDRILFGSTRWPCTTMTARARASSAASHRHDGWLGCCAWSIATRP